MEFDFNTTKAKKLGLVIKHRNDDDVVAFFDENDKAAFFELRLFRLNSSFLEEGFLSKKTTMERLLIKGNDKIKECYLNSWSNDPSYCGKKILVQKATQNFYGCVAIRDENGNRIERSGYESGRDFYNVRYIIEESFSEIKYIATIETDRDKLYFKIDFLPIGNYLAVLIVNDRNGETISESIPYYFKIEKKDNTKLLESVEKSLKGSPRYF